jgi:hypothetical protein
MATIIIPPPSRLRRLECRLVRTNGAVRGADSPENDCHGFPFRSSGPRPPVGGGLATRGIIAALADVALTRLWKETRAGVAIVRRRTRPRARGTAHCTIRLGRSSARRASCVGRKGAQIGYGAGWRVVRCSDRRRSVRHRRAVPDPTSGETMWPALCTVLSVSSWISSCFALDATGPKTPRSSFCGHQLAVLDRQVPRPRFEAVDRVFLTCGGRKLIRRG